MRHFSRQSGRATALVVFWAAAAAFMVWAGDTAASDRAVADDAATRTTANSEGRDGRMRAAPVDVCTLMPLKEVARIMAPALALQRRPKPPSMQADGDMCHYDFPVDPHPYPGGNGPKVQVGLEAPDMGTVQNARVSFRNQHQMAVDRPGLINNLAALGGFGDEAFVSDESGTFSAGITVRKGSRIVRGIVGVDETEFSFRLPLAKALTAELLQRLP